MFSTSREEGIVHMDYLGGFDDGVPSLAALSRSTIRNNIKHKKIKKLPLPTLLKNFCT